MPTMSDVTVVASTYQTSANARPQKLSTGEIVEVMYDSVSGHIKFYKTNASAVSTYLGFVNFGASLTVYWTVVVKDDVIHVITAYSGATGSQSRSFKANECNSGDITLLPSHKVTNVDTGQTAFNGINAILNGSSIEVAESTKNSSYPSSFNIRYVKGTINADGSVTWGAVEQRTTQGNSSYNWTYPTLFIDLNNNVGIVCLENNVLRYLGVNGLSLRGGISGKYTDIYDGTSYGQSSITAIFVPQSINGLVNGRIWVAWQGTDSTDPTYNNIRVSYSDDGGSTWSSMTKLTSGNVYNQMFPSITADKHNNIYVLFEGSTSIQSGTDFRIKQAKNSNGVWGSITELKSAESHTPSTLYDLTVNFSSPLFIYKSVTGSKVGFYGTWTIFTPMTAFSLPSSNQLAKANLDTLRQKVNDFRTANGIATKVWTDPTIITGVTPVKAIHVNELQSAIDEVYSTNQTNYTNSITMGKIKEILSAKSSPLDYPLRVNHLINALQNI